MVLPAVMDPGMSPLDGPPGRASDEAQSGNLLSPEFSVGPLGDKIRKGGILEVSRGPPACASASEQEQSSVQHSAAPQDSAVTSFWVCHF